MTTEWRMVRLRVKTVLALEELAKVWYQAYGLGLRGVPEPGERFAYSIDKMVRILLERDNDHRRRGKKVSPQPAIPGKEPPGNGGPAAAPPGQAEFPSDVYIDCPGGPQGEADDPDPA